MNRAPEEKKEDVGQLEVLRRRIYQRDVVFPEKKRRRLHEHKDLIPAQWGEEETEEIVTPKKKKKWPVMIKVFLGALVLCAGSLGFLWYMLFLGKSEISSEKIILDVTAKNFVDGGEDIGYRVSIKNTNAVDLIFSDLVIEYPTTKEGGQIERTRTSLGKIASRGQVVQPYDIVLFGEEGEQREITATLEYRVEGSTSILTKAQEVLVGIRTAPVRITMNAPENIVNQQAFEVDFTVNSNSLRTLDSVRAIAQYPNGFVFESASPQPTIGTNVWDLGSMRVRDEQKVVIKGYIEGSTDEQKGFIAEVGIADRLDERSIETLFAATSRVLELTPPFLDVDLQIDGLKDSPAIARSEDAFAADITLTNNSGDQITDVRVTMNLSGNGLNEAQVRPSNGARYNSTNNTIVWSQANAGTLDRLGLGESVKLDARITLLPLVIPNTGEILTNPKVNVSVDIEALSPDGLPLAVKRISTHEVRVKTIPEISIGTLYSSGPLPNTGPVPLESNKATTYTLKWDLTNTSNAFSSARVETQLREGVEWVGSISPNTESVTYDAIRKKLVWDLGDVQAEALTPETRRTVYMQVRVQPSAADRGQELPLTNNVVFEGLDTYTNTSIQDVTGAHTTELVGDSITNDGVVK